jgi:D-glycero-beta-D-manno-heptose 1-phosphate adenylyltransferase
MSFHNQLEKKIVAIEDISRFVNVFKLNGKRIVFTNGCFDILHPGHVDYLSKARDLGDVLVIGLNTDDSVKRQNKGPNRPVNTQDSRAKVLAALGCVDAIVYFSDDTPYELIKKVMPDFLVKGGDWAVDKIVGHDIVTAHGGKVLSIPFVEGFSTTGLINKLKA